MGEKCLALVYRNVKQRKLALHSEISLSSLVSLVAIKGCRREQMHIQTSLLACIGPCVWQLTKFSTRFYQSKFVALL